MRVIALVAIETDLTPEEYELNAQLGGEPLWDVGIAINEYFTERAPDSKVRLTAYTMDFPVPVSESAPDGLLHDDESVALRRLANDLPPDMVIP